MVFLSYIHPTIVETAYMDAKTLGMFNNFSVRLEFPIFNLKRKFFTLLTRDAIALDSLVYSHTYSFKPI